MSGDQKKAFSNENEVDTVRYYSHMCSLNELTYFQ